MPNLSKEERESIMRAVYAEGDKLDIKKIIEILKFDADLIQKLDVTRKELGLLSRKLNPINIHISTIRHDVETIGKGPKSFVGLDAVVSQLREHFYMAESNIRKAIALLKTA
jgi:hypothetical protein